MIQYFMKMKYKGNPKPRNYNYLQFYDNWIGYLFMIFKQQEQSES
jgi:hypothetical protein